LDSFYEQDLARREHDAAQGNAGAAHRMAPGTPNPLRLPGSSQEFIEISEDQKIKIESAGRPEWYSASKCIPNPTDFQRLREISP
jgi:hypothetical protein